MGEWTSTGDHKTRTVKFLMVVNNPLVKLNRTDCVEVQTCEVEEDYLRYSYSVRSSVLAMPYSDAFTPVLRYCITYESKDRCKLVCASGIEWHKNPLVKAMIKGAVLKGTAETIRDLVEILQFHLEHHRQQGQTSAKRVTLDSSAANGSSSFGGHSRSDSAKIIISLHGTDDDHKILLDPLDNNSASDLHAEMSKESRAPGARRHTVSAAASGGVMYSGPRVQGHWPTGSQPSFVPIGSKASRTKLLGRPSRSTLKDESQTATKDGAFASSSKSNSELRMSNLFGLLRSKDEAHRRWATTRLLFVVLVASSIINIWAAFNSQRMVNSAWKMQGHGVSDRYEPLQGYPEPLCRMTGFGSMKGPKIHHGGDRNVRVAARAVFLRDLEEQMLSGESDEFEDGRTIDHKTFEIFLEVRDSFRAWSKPPVEWLSDAEEMDQGKTLGPSSAATTATLSPSASPRPSSSPSNGFGDENDSTARYPWLLPQHRRWATRIIFQRDRVGIMRHDLLVTFELLKQLERRLLETEYVNWLMDERSRCRLWEHRRRSAADKQKQTKAGLDAGADAVEEPEQSTPVSSSSSSISAEKGEEIDLKGTFLRQLETDQELNAERVKEQLVHEHEHPGQEKGEVAAKGNVQASRKTPKENRKKIKDQVTADFCSGLDRQMELFLVDPTASV